jgi:hypothetical protein
MWGSRGGGDYTRLWMAIHLKGKTMPLSTSPPQAGGDRGGGQSDPQCVLTLTWVPANWASGIWGLPCETLWASRLHTPLFATAQCYQAIER